MADATPRDKFKRLVPADHEIDQALEAALREEETRTQNAPLVGPALSMLRENMLVEGKVVAVTDDRVLVDVNYKSEAVIPKDEFGDHPPAPGTTVSAWIMQMENQDGQILLSHREAVRRQVWDHVAGSDKSKILAGKVTEAVKGGLVVDIGVRAFMPAREVDVRFVEDLSIWNGRNIECRILEVDRANKKVIVSRRAILQEERAKKRDALFATLAPGQTMRGTVSNITDFGVFVDIGGTEGLIHKGDLAWGKVNHPSEIVKSGEEVTVTVLTFDRQSGKISLGLKQAGPSPWDDAPVRYAVGRRAKGRVVGLLEFGAVLEFEPGIQGLCHISEMSWNRRVRKPDEVVQLNDVVEVEVVGLDLAKKKISLSIKRVEENPWSSLEQRYPFATIVDGTVSELTEFGAFVKLDDGVEGLVHVSELTWLKRPKHPNEVVKVGQRVKAIVMGNDAERQRLSLSIKNTEPDPWWDVESDFAVGKVIPAKITRLEAFGAFAELRPGLEGLIHISRLGDGARINHPKDVVKSGQQVQVEVVEVSEENRRLALKLIPTDDEAD